MKVNAPLTSRELALMSLLSDGHAYSVTEIANALYIGDPRSSIRNLRNKGVNICDYWAQSQEGRYKRYYITNR